MLAFSRRQVLEPTIVDLGALTHDLQKMLRRLIGENLRLVVETSPDLGLVCADAGQLEQVIVNIVVNARDALGATGRIAIRLTNAEIDEEFAASHVPITPGNYVRISISDTGCGMDALTQRRIFEPFFSTKKERGTGYRRRTGS